MSSTAVTLHKDHDARLKALDTSRSFLVQAPAGSGKTELLAQRFLALLAIVDDPGQVLAITFTRAATAEMQLRILRKLEQARQGHPEALPEAVDALRNADSRGWRILERPQQLNIQTIDSLCLRVARQLPITTQLGETLQPVDDASALYKRAARRLMNKLGGEDVYLNHALTELLKTRDNNVAECERLIAEMLATRDHWQHTFVMHGSVDWYEVRQSLELPFRNEIRRTLARARELLAAHSEISNEVLALAVYACDCGNSKVKLLADAPRLPLATEEFLGHWQCWCEFLLTREGEWRKQVSVREGFPPANPRMKNRMRAVLKQVAELDGMLQLLRDIRELPPPTYEDQEWQLLKQLFTALRYAADELKEVFREAGRVDFPELGIAARRILQLDAPESRFELRHLLVDEFQDTSRKQHELVEAIIRDWQPGDGRTCFLVGDPMQSIYMFRQAEVELFKLVSQRGIKTDYGWLRPDTLRLTTNFRSSSAVVNPLNSIFEKVFPDGRPELTSSVPFQPGAASRMVDSTSEVHIHANFRNELEREAGETEDELAATQETEYRRAEQDETRQITELIKSLLSARPTRVRNTSYTIAVLGRAKRHLFDVARALREEDIRYRAVELETLHERQEVLDLRSLTHALLHPMDRVAWLSIFRAPWCGLELRDLHRLCGTDSNPKPQTALLEEARERLSELDDEPRMRAQRTLTVLEAALRMHYQQSSLSAWVERTWHTLGGPACLDAAGHENALAYFRLLDELALDGIDASGPELEQRLTSLFASPDPRTNDRDGVQLMTIHKAKGLGFDVVIVPGLEREDAKESSSLIKFFERTTQQSNELLVAPIGNKGEDNSRLCAWLQKQINHREAEERKRLLYVACTRAADEVHLFGTATVKQGDIVPGGTKSLLSTGWVALEETFQRQWQAKIAREKVIEMPAAASGTGPGIVQLAAAASSAKSYAPNLLRRLPLNWYGAHAEQNTLKAEDRRPTDMRGPDGFSHRPEVSGERRVLGTVVHALLEEIAHHGPAENRPEADAIAINRLKSMATSLLRNAGLPTHAMENLRLQAIDAVLAALEDDHGRWILARHSGATSETAWTGLLNGAISTIRVDRTFWAGPEPLAEGHDHLWIVDYKTAQYRGSDVEDFFAAERLVYSGQLENYCQMMRKINREEFPVRLGLYYPFMRRLIWWAA